MEYTIDYNPIWDSAGKLRDGCTLRTAVEWITAVGINSYSAICVNGELTNLNALSLQDASFLDKPIKRLSSLYYGTLSFDV